MSNAARVPHINLPPGLSLVPDGAGGFDLVSEKELLSRTVAFRLPMSDYASLQVFIESFPERTVAVALRWLLRHPDVMTLMLEHVHAQETRGSAPRGGPSRASTG